GPYQITVNGTEITTGHGLRGKARELLAYLAVHRHGVTADTAIEALWPADDPIKAQPHYRTLVANLRWASPRSVEGSF
ncbi:MAG TPA: hypothetical protein VLL25_10930, partial [Acidimicrobiales bacterium]|nr:hypothetical protein [Acidimicrobiales bacterium]